MKIFLMLALCTFSVGAFPLGAGFIPLLMWKGLTVALQFAAIYCMGLGVIIALDFFGPRSLFRSE